MLKIEKLNKHYGKYHAVRDLDLNVGEGEIFGFIGPNGAGKTTTIKIVSGLLTADNGAVYINGIDAINHSDEAKKYIGYMPDFFGVYDNLKVGEYLDFYSAIYGLEHQEVKKLKKDLLQLVDLEEKEESYVDDLSRGMKQRLCLARCLIHNPKLLVLDEPASGMDPRARAHMKKILRTLKDMGKTIIVSSHILSELSEICTSIGIIERGQLIISGSVEEVSDKVFESKLLHITLLDKVDETVTCLKEFSFIRKIKTKQNKVEAVFGGDNIQMNQVLKELIKRDIPVVTYQKEIGNLEDVFMHVTEGV